MRSRLVTHTPGAVHIRLHFIFATLVTIAGLVLSAATAVQAQASNVIYGCVNQNGLVRIINSRLSAMGLRDYVALLQRAQASLARAVGEVSDGAA